MNRLVLILASLTVLSGVAPADATPPARGCTSSEAHAFDFWIGDWDVTSPDGRTAGHNRIEPILGGCALAEHWTGARGSRGTSTNAWDAKTHRWRQFWVDADGDVLCLEGGLVDGRMVLTSPPRGAHVDRITWTPNADGSVRQLWETTENDGSTWAVAFDGLYRRAH